MRRTQIVLVALIAAAVGWGAWQKVPAFESGTIPSSCTTCNGAGITCTDGDLKAPSDWLKKNSHGVLVTPPASFCGKFDTNCEFYIWSWQEFLNLTQPSDPNKPSSNITLLNLAPAQTLFPPTPGTEPPSWKDASGASAAGVNGKPRVTKDDPDAADDAQAGSGELLVTSKGAGANPVYYSMHVNQCYYEFVQSNSLYKQSVQAGLKPTDKLATFPVGAVETKAAWIIAGTYTDAADTTPTYVVPDPDRFFMADGYVGEPVVGTGGWTESTTLKKVRLALVGLHIAGMVENHPEMVWATFEHKDNAPDVGTDGKITDKVNPRKYKDGKTTKNLPWTLYDGKAAATDCNVGIAAKSGAKLDPTNVCELNPYGMKPGDDSTNTKNITSLNASVLNKLKKAGGSVWSNYFLSGAVWTFDPGTDKGVLPAKNDAKNPANGNVKGSVYLSNMTMESFTQYGTHISATSQNCMSCHNTFAATGRQSLPISVSHLIANHAQPAPTKKSLVKLYSALDLKDKCFTPPKSVQMADGIPADKWQQCMLGVARFDLWKAEDVIANAPGINGMVTSKQMPPKNMGGPLSDDALAVWAQFYTAYKQAYGTD
ncbi:MAG: hypothetical protein ACYTGL_05580 [Planctomycetota bacterium]